MNGRAAERGGSLAEALVALLLVLVVLGAALPVLGQARAVAAACVSAAGEGAALRAAMWRLERDLERAGFGLPDSVSPLRIEDPSVGLSVAFLGGGFAGGIAIRAAVPAGARTVGLAALMGIEAGDEVVLRDRSGHVFLSRLAAIDGARDEVELAGPLPFTAEPEHGARLWRLERHVWEWGVDGVRRNGQSFVERPLAVILHALRPETLAVEAFHHQPLGEAAGSLLTLHVGSGGGETAPRVPGLPLTVAWRAPRPPADAALPLP
jgi:hypothetical protein